MRIFYGDAGPIDTLLQIAAGPVSDGDLVSKSARDKFTQLDMVARCQGWNIITAGGQKVIDALSLCRQPRPVEEQATENGACVGSASAGETRPVDDPVCALVDAPVEIFRAEDELGRLAGRLTFYGARVALRNLWAAGYEVVRVRT